MSRTLADLFVKITGDDRPLNRTAARAKQTLTSLDRTTVEPKVTMGDPGPEIRQLKRQLETLAKTKIKLDFDQRTISSQIGLVERRLDGLRRKKTELPVELQDKAQREIVAVERELDGLRRRQTVLPLKIESTGLAFNQVRKSIHDLSQQVTDEAPTLKRTIGRTMVDVGEHGGRKLGEGFTIAKGAVAGALGSLAATGVTALLSLGKQAATTGVQTAAGMETARIGFTTMLGSARKADTFLKSLADFAAKTPFEFPELQQSASQLIAIGINANDVIPIMKTLGDITAGMGTGSEGIQRAVVAIQQMNAAGRIQAEDLNQLRDAGVPVYELLSKATGKSAAQIAKMASSGKLGRKELDQLMAALKSGRGLERFNGLMQKTSVSLTGLWSTLKDTFSQGLAKALEPIIPLLKTGLTNAISGVGRVMPAVAKGLGWFTDAVTGLYRLLVKGDFTGAFRRAFGFAEDSGLVDKLLTIRDGVLKVVSAFRGLGKNQFLTGEIAPRISGIAGAYQGLGRTVTPILARIGGAISKAFASKDAQVALGKLGDLVKAGLDLIQTRVETITAAISYIWGRWGDDITRIVGDKLQRAIRIIGDVFSIIAGLFKTSTALMKGDWSGAWDGIKQTLSGVLSGIEDILGVKFAAMWKGITGWVGRIRDSVVGGFTAVRDRIVGVWNGIVGGVQTAWAAISAAVSRAVGFVGRVISMAVKPWVTVFKVAFIAITTLVLLAFGAITKIVMAVWTPIWRRVIKPTWDAITKGFSAAGAWLRRTWTTIWTAVKNTASTAWNWVYGRLIKPVWDRIRSAFSVAAGIVKTTWGNFWTSIKNAARAAWNWVYDNLIKPVWSRISGSFKSAQTGVKSRWDGFWGGIKSAAKAAMDAVKSRIDTVLGKIKDAFSTAKANIGRVWDGVKSKVSSPINWVKDHVYNKPLVPVWNRVASLVNGPKLRTYSTGGIDDPHGVQPGYTPGRDTHLIGVGGGEAVMRPEWTRAAGANYIDGANAAARAGGVSGAKEYIANNGLPGGQSKVDGYAGGGIVGWLKNTLGAVGNGIGNLAGKLKGWVLGGLRAAAAKILDPLKSTIRKAMPAGGVGQTVGGIGVKAINLLLDKIKSSDAAAAPAPGGGTYNGPLPGVGPSAARALALRLGANPVFWHTDPQGGRAFDAMSNIPTGNRIVAALLRGRRQYDIRYLIHNMRIWSARNWGGRPYTPITNSGDFRHVHHVHASFGMENGGIVRGGRGGVTTQIGEGRHDELVLPLPKGWDTTRSSNPDSITVAVNRLVAAIEAHGLQGDTIQFGDVLVQEGSEAQGINKRLQRVGSGYGLV